MESKSRENKNVIKETWRLLDQSIYVGERLESHLKALFLVSIFTTVLCVVLIIVNIATRQYIMLVPSIVAALAGVGCAYCSRVMKNVKIASIIPTIFCGIMKSTMPLLPACAAKHWQSTATTNCA